MVDGFALPARARLRHIPGSAPVWLLGHMLTAKTKHNLFLFDMWEDMGAKYGKVGTRDGCHCWRRRGR